MRFLAAAGVRPLLLDWGFPGAVERGFTLTDYVAGRLERAMVSLGAPVTLAGYCMGGLMAVAAAQRRPDLVSRLALLAVPWDFHAEDEAAALRLAALLPGFEPMLAAGGTLPIDALQMLFALLDPGSVAMKYRDFGMQDQASARARMFVAMEDWLNDGVPLAAAVGARNAGRMVWGEYGRERTMAHSRTAGAAGVASVALLGCHAVAGPAGAAQECRGTGRADRRGRRPHAGYRPCGHGRRIQRAGGALAAPHRVACQSGLISLP